MSTLSRYVLGELLKVFLIALSAITGLFVMFGIVNQAVRENLGLTQIVLLLPYVLPEALRFAVPAAILLATCSVYGRFSASNEVVAIKSMGISPMVVIWPSLIFSFLLSLTTVWLNDVAVSWGRHGMQRVIIESVEEIAYSMLRTRHSYSSGQFSINVNRVEGRTLVRPIITLQGSGPALTATAVSAELRSDPEINSLTIILHEATVERGPVRLQGIPRYEYSISLDQASRYKGSSNSPSNLALSTIPEEKERQVEEIRAREQEMAATAAMQMITGDIAELTAPNWRSERRSLEDAKERLFRLHVEPHRRWANGFSCLCFVLVGVPLAILWRRGDVLSTFAAVFFPILLVYYPLLLGGVDQAKSGAIPPQAVWAGNVILTAWGLWLLKRVIRY